MDMRRSRLRSYNFECACAACTLDWPVVKFLPELEPPASDYAALVKAALSNCAAADGRGLNFQQVSDDALYNACKYLQRAYFQPEARSRLDKNYRALELLMYYYFSSKTIFVNDE